MRIRGRAALLLMLPATLLYVLFVVYPLIRGVQMSFTDSRGVVGGNFVGLDNYRKLAADPEVWQSFRNTITYTIGVVIVQNALALFLAAWLFRQPRVRNFVRASLLFPAMMALIAVAYIWGFIYSPFGGPLNELLEAVGLGSLEQSWLGNARLAMPSIAAVYIWMYLGYAATIFLANYLAIPAEIFEAAAIDGAKGWRRFVALDWRLLAPALTVNVTLSTIGSLRMFDLPFIMTSGGPDGATETLSYTIYYQSFREFNFGYGTAIAVVLLVVTIIVAVVQSALLRRREVDLA